MDWFIVPDLDGPISGGTLYDRLLIASANDAGCPSMDVPVDWARAVVAGASAVDRVWVDSLYLEEFPALVRVAGRRLRVALLAHYLPSLVSRGDGLGASDLSQIEVAALAAASLVLVPSPFMRGMVERLAGADRTILCLEPGRVTKGRTVLPAPPVQAVMVANLVPGKGVAPFLACLAEQILPSDHFHLTIVGGASFDRACAQICFELGDEPRLRGRVRFVGQQTPAATLRHMSASNLFVSASVMESFGMALAEARTLGLPIVASAGGNVAALVSAGCGGELVTNPSQLAAASLRLGRDAGEHRRRLALASATALAPRPWSEVGREFRVKMARLDTGAPPGAGLREGEAHADGS
jgi:glycosyltransferase involved in cell wall biosynthesis